MSCHHHVSILHSADFAAAHDSMSAKMLPLMDAGTRTALLDFEPHLDNTVLLLISDHGLHYGKHVESFAGQVRFGGGLC